MSRRIDFRGIGHAEPAQRFPPDFRFTQRRLPTAPYPRAFPTYHGLSSDSLRRPLDFDAGIAGVQEFQVETSIPPSYPFAFP